MLSPSSTSFAGAAQAFWSMLDDLAENDPRAYQSFLRQQMHGFMSSARPSTQKETTSTDAVFPPSSGISSAVISSSKSDSGDSRRHDRVRRPPPFRPSPGFVIRTQLEVWRRRPNVAAEEDRGSSAPSAGASALIVELDDREAAERGKTEKGKTDAGHDIVDRFDYFINVCSSSFVRCPTRKQDGKECQAADELKDSNIPVSVGLRRFLPSRSTDDDANDQRRLPKAKMASSNSFRQEEEGSATPGVSTGKRKLPTALRTPVPLLLPGEDDGEWAYGHFGENQEKKRRVCVDVCVHPVVIQKCKADLKLKFYVAATCISRLLLLEQLLLLRCRVASSSAPCCSFPDTQPSRSPSSAEGIEKLLRVSSPEDSAIEKAEDEDQELRDFFGSSEAAASAALSFVALREKLGSRGIGENWDEEVRMAEGCLRFPKLRYKGGTEPAKHTVQADCVMQAQEETGHKADPDGRGQGGEAHQVVGTRGRQAHGEKAAASSVEPASRGKEAQRKEDEEARKSGIVMPLASDVTALREQTEKREHQNSSEPGPDLVARALDARDKAAQRALASRRKQSQKGGDPLPPLIEVVGEKTYSQYGGDELQPSDDEHPEIMRRLEAKGEDGGRQGRDGAGGGKAKERASDFLVAEVKTSRHRPCSAFSASSCPSSGPLGASSSCAESRSDEVAVPEDRSFPIVSSPESSSNIPGPLFAASTPARHSSSPANANATVGSSVSGSCSSPLPPPQVTAASASPSCRFSSPSSSSAEGRDEDICRGSSAARNYLSNPFDSPATTGDEGRLWRVTHRGDGEKREIRIVFAHPVVPEGLEVTGSHREIEVSGVLLADSGEAEATMTGGSQGGASGKNGEQPFYIRLPLPYDVDPDQVRAPVFWRRVIVTATYSRGSPCCRRSGCSLGRSSFLDNVYAYNAWTWEKRERDLAGNKTLPEASAARALLCQDTDCPVAFWDGMHGAISAHGTVREKLVGNVML